MKRHLPASDPGTLDPCAVDDAAIGYSSLIGIIGHDSSSGVLRLEQDERHTQNHDGMIRIAWPDARYGKTINDAMHYLEHLSKQEDGLLQADGRLIPNPLWQIGPEALTDLIAQPRGPVLTVHPLGGCPMGTCVEDGVVDQYGMVFNAQQNQPPGTRKNKAEMDDWQGSLFVLDGSIIPASLGANPALTIATLSQRASQHLRTQWLKAPAPLLPSAPPGAMQSAPVAAGPRPIFRAPEDCISPARPTKLKMAERLVGNMLIYRDDGVMDDYWVELTLHYEAIELRKLMSTLKRHVTLEVPSATSGSSIRIFHKDDWAQLEFGSERERDAKALLKASLTGTLEIFDQEASTVGCRITRSLWAWFRNRGLRDLSQRAIEAWNEPGNKLDKLWNLPKATLKKGKEFFNIASHAGQVRRLDYKLTIGAGQVRHDSNVFKHRPYQGLHLCGEKRLTYARRANPLRQLSDLHITDFPSMPGGVNAKLSLDLRFVALQEIPLAQIVAQKNQITALADIASFGLYILRLMLLTHIWTFRKPDPSPTRKPERLPQALPKAVRAGSEWKDLEPEITEIDLRPAVRNTLAPGNKPGDDIPVRVRLSRFRKPNVCDACRTDLKPLILIHGYSASGSTFAHPAIGTSMAQYFVERCRDVWILDLRTSAGMPSAVLPWHFEDAALEDIPVAIAHILRVTGADQVDIFAHCIGATMLSMAILTDPAKIEDVFPHDLVAWPKPPRRFYRQELALMQNSIRRIVLSQKGPALVYTADNMLRAWIMRSLRELLLPDNFQFSVEEDASLRDQLVDRWLNVLPYPEEEFDAENPFLWHKPWQWGKRTPWVGFRHRMDALYARDFSVNNLDEITLNAIDDLFGPLNLETVSQAIHFVRANKITDAYGRNQFVSRANLQAHWSRVEHTMSIHGAKNGLVDKETLKRMTALMQDANIRFTAHEAFEDFGHQDMLIGRDNIKVFEEIEKFLAAPASAGTQAIAAGFTPGLVCDLPWLGPRLEAHPDEQNRVAVMSDPKIGNAMVLCIPVRPGSKGGFELPAGYRTPIVPERAPAYHWVNYQVPDELLTLDSVTAYLVVMLYEEAGAASQTIPTIGPEPDPLTKAPLLPDPEPVQPDQLVAILHSLQQQYDSDSEAFASALLSKDEIITPIGKGSAAPVSLVLAFGSCQYPVGLMDRPVAQASIERLAHRLRLLPPHVQDPATLKPELLLLLGDQIYSDATAGLLDPSRADARYLRPHEDWLRMPPLREVMRKIPVYCMLDDHEIIDNWSPLRAHAKSWHMTQGRKYYRQFQPRVSNPLPLQQGSQDLWCAFLHKGIPFFMCDTRTERMERKAGNAQHASIMEKRQMRALKHWLIRNCDPTQPKIISSASILLPRHVASASDSLHQDGWEGFPASLYEILAFIGENQIHNV
ncbi:MAG: hypothetical protein RL748_1837, partial [Pseudomonadota bacterium]